MSATSFENWLAARGGDVPDAPSLADGEDFGGYVLAGFLGRGGFSEVYRAHNVALGVSAAVKVLRRDKGDAAERFEREARFLMADSHPALPRFFAYGRREGVPFMAIEELEQRPLPSRDGEVADFLLRLCEGVAHLHALGFVHRDIKPENILFRADGSPVLIDFGLVKRMVPASAPPSADPTISVVDGRRVAIGTPGFSAPEQFTGGDVTPASDIHALGALARACFGGNAPAAWRPVIRRATSSIPGERYPTVQAFARAVRYRRVRYATPFAAAALAVALVAGAWAVSAALHRTPAYLAPAERLLGELVQTRRDAEGAYGYVKLNGDGREIDQPVHLGRRRRLVVEGPGALFIALTGDRGSRVEVRRCALFNRTHDAERQPRYTIVDGSLLNFVNLPALDESDFAEPYDTNTCAVLFSATTESLRHLVPRLNPPRRP